MKRLVFAFVLLASGLGVGLALRGQQVTARDQSVRHPVGTFQLAGTDVGMRILNTSTGEVWRFTPAEGGQGRWSLESVARGSSNDTTGFRARALLEQKVKLELARLTSVLPDLTKDERGEVETAIRQLEAQIELLDKWLTKE